MPFYLFQGRYTPASFKAMVDNPQDREASARALITGLGGKLHSFFFSFGPDDFIALVEAADDTMAAAASFAIGASGGFSGGSTTKLMTAKEAMAAMKLAKTATQSYAPPKA